MELLLLWHMQLNRQHSFLYGLVIMMFWVMQQQVEMEQINLLPAGAAGVGFDATMMHW
jgi:hypothetical protein